MLHGPNLIPSPSSAFFSPPTFNFLQGRQMKKHHGVDVFQGFEATTTTNPFTPISFNLDFVEYIM